MTSIANKYNAEFKHAPTSSVLPYSFKLDPEDVWQAFYLHCLVDDCADQGVALFLPNGGTQAERLKAAIEAANSRVVADGQEYWNHACDHCLRIVDREKNCRVFLPLNNLYEQQITYVFCYKAVSMLWLQMVYHLVA